MKTETVTTDPREGFEDYNSPEAMDVLWSELGWDGAPDYPMIYDRIVRSVPPGSKVLDLGCGVGKLLHRLRVQRGCECKGIDHSPVASKIGAEHGVDIEVRDIKEFPVGIERWDVVIATEVIEHLDEPEKFVQLCYRLVKPGGILFFAVPKNTLGPEEEKAHKRTYTIDQFGDMLHGLIGDPLELYVAHDRMLATHGNVDYKSYFPEITLPLMLKNESATLRRTLESAKDVVAEIQVWIDDKTTDDTEKICREYTDWIRYFTWEDDFAKIRNMQIEAATKDWILVLDGHEYLLPSGIEYLKSVGDIADYVGSVRACVLMEKVDVNTPGYMFYHPRLFRNFWGCHWVSPVHNALRVPFGRNPWVDKFTIQHERGYDRGVERTEQRKTMNKAYLLKRLEEEPEATGPLFYLGIQYHSEGNNEEAEKYFKRHLEVCKRPQERGQTAINLSVLYYQMGRLDDSRGLLFEYLPDNWDRPEVYSMLGVLAEGNNAIEEARHWANVAAHTRPGMNPFFLSWPAHTYLPYQQLAGIYEASGDIESASKCARKMFEYRDDPDLLLKVEKAEKFIEERRRGNGNGS